LAHSAPATFREEGSPADFLIPPPNSDESAAKGKVFAAAYKDYIKSLGDDPNGINLQFHLLSFRLTFMINSHLQLIDKQ
jgi:hypothetical protein